MSWQVEYSRKAKKQYDKLPIEVRATCNALIAEVEKSGPVRGNWKKYGKLAGGEHHCHIRPGKPTYVACWKEYKKEKIVEVYYVGTHEKAPY